MKPIFKRIELNTRIFGSTRFRLSRTNLPTPALSWHPFRGFSLNTRHGARVSKTFSGITLGFQNTRFTFKGRWQSNFFGLNLNASKSGFSISQRNLIGTYNFTNPNRSSANLFGIQIRGKDAAPWAFLGLIISLPIHIYDALLVILKILLWVSKIVINLSIFILNLIYNIFKFILSFSWYLVVAMICIIVPDIVINPRAENEDEKL